MRRLLWFLAFCGLLAIAAPSWAWTDTYCWAATPSGTSYQFYTSVDGGATWVLAQTLTVPFTSPAACSAGSVGLTFTGASPGLTLMRVGACNIAGCTIRSQDGLWHNDSFPVQVTTPPAPGSVGVI
jgi:hypothetical protein